MIAHRLKSQLCMVLLLVVALCSGVQAGDKREPIVIEDAAFGEVLFYYYQEDYFPAIVRLLAAQQQSRLPNHDSESELLLGGLYLSYGHHLRAAEIFERLLADNVDPAIRDRTWFFLAKIWQQRGYLAESQNALDSIQGKLPKGIEDERYMLQAINLKKIDQIPLIVSKRINAYNLHLVGVRA